MLKLIHQYKMQSQPKGMQWGGMYPISDEQARYLQTQVCEAGEMS